MIILSDRIYKGLHNGMDRVAYNLLVAKFQKSQSAQRIINSYAVSDLKGKMKGINLIVAIAPRDSHSSIVRQLAEAIAKAYRLPLLLMDKGQTLSPTKRKNCQGKSILIVDDVVYTGATLEKATKAITPAKPKKIQYYTLAKSKSYKEKNDKGMRV